MDTRRRPTALTLTTLARRGITAVLCALLLALTSAAAPAARAGQTAASTTAPDRTKAPAPGPVPNFQIPAIEKLALSNGLPVWIVEMHEVPVVDVRMIVKSGGSADPADRYGLADYTASMLDEGAGSRDALELADAIDFLGATLTTDAGFDSSVVRLRTLVSTFDDALPLMADVVLRPTFEQDDMERLRVERETTLVQIRDDVSQLASAAYTRLLFGPRYRYGTPLLGTRTSNRAISLDDIRTFYTQHYQPQNAHLLVVGDVTRAGVIDALESAFGGWKNGEAVAPADLPAAQRPAGRQIYLVDKPGAGQSQIRIGTVGVARTTPDYFVLDVLNTMLGGSFTSRLNQNLREEHGYSYGAGSSFVMRRAPGPFVAQAGVQADKTAESLTEFFKELEGMHAPVPAAELEGARNLEALSFPRDFETASNMSARLADLVVYGLPESLFNDYVPRIQAVTQADVQRAAERYLPTDDFIVVVAGDLATIEQPVRALNLAPVTVVSADDVLE